MKNFFKKKRNLKDFFKEAKKENWALGQFNFSTLEQLQGIAVAGKSFDVPVICGTSQGEADFFGIREVACVARIIKEEYKVDLFLNLDHGKSFDVVKKAIDAGYDMVHFDGSDMPLEQNIEITKKVVAYARRRGVLVEGEVSKIGGSSVVSSRKAEDITLTSLDKIVRFTKETGVDCIALDVGNVHGVYLETPRLYLERIDELLKRVSVFVVLHGGSGIEEKKIKEAISRGIVKININTEIRDAWQKSLKKFLAENPEEIVPYKILPNVRESVCEKVEEKIKIFKNA